MNVSKVLAISALLSVASLAAQAATVTCPGLGTQFNGGPTTRAIQVTGALAGGLCAYQEGNFTGDNFEPYLGAGYTLIDKDIAPAGSAEGGLLYTIDPGSNNAAGTWAMASNLWLSYAEIYLAFHFGGGQGTPDSFIVQLDPLSQAGEWDLIPTSLANGLSNIYLLGRGLPPPPPQEIPVPGTLLLAGTALIALSRFARRKQSA